MLELKTCTRLNRASHSATQLYAIILDLEQLLCFFFNFLMLSFLYFYYCFLNCELVLWVPKNKFLLDISHMFLTQCYSQTNFQVGVYVLEAELTDCSVSSKDSISLTLSFSPFISIFLLCPFLLLISSFDSLLLL